jgi:bifunctional N-acetylglucosamine-1-phosphate-uridyltransferase/glucosamine-1-phosphate-acetyltransferase GlmU-like protein
MGSTLPKVLYEINGKPMIHYCVELLESVRVHEIVLVVGYKHELVRDRFQERVGSIRFAIQEQQLGTGHAVMQAETLFAGFDGYVYVIYGDMPLLKPRYLEDLARVTHETGATGAILTLSMPDPPEWGRIVRDSAGNVVRIVEVKDATPEVLAIQEVNVGVYYMHAPALFDALRKIGPANTQKEYYLTDVVEVLAREGLRVSTTLADNLDDVFGINAPYQLEYAGALSHIEYAEGLYQIIDAVAALRRPGKTS